MINNDPSKLIRSIIKNMYRVFMSRNQGSISGQVIAKTQKWYLMPRCLTLSIIR